MKTGPKKPSAPAGTGALENNGRTVIHPVYLVFCPLSNNFLADIHFK